MSNISQRPANMKKNGHLIKIHALEVKGKFVNYRRAFGWATLLAILIIPWLQFKGMPLLQLDPELRRISAFGVYLTPADTQILVTGIIASLIGIVAMTARFGRVWCGWACPQTLMLHWIAEPIQRVIQGRATQRKRDEIDGGGLAVLRRALYVTVMFFVSLALGHSFLSYFAGTQAVFFEYWQSPSAYPITTFFAILFTGGVFVDLVILREVFCTALCPYARLQGVLTDEQSLMVKYVEERGEPRQQRKATAGEAFGDCTNCDMCHKVCPTGIDIRDGYQLECIGCARCIDACNTVMAKQGKEPHLVGYHRAKPIVGFHARSWIYGTIITILLLITAWRFLDRGEFKADWLRQGNTPFVVQGDSVINLYQLRVRSNVPHDQEIQLQEIPNLSHNFEGKTIVLKGGAEMDLPLQIKTHKSIFVRGKARVTLTASSNGHIKEGKLPLQGPAF